jgi:hypothetical protein
MCTNVSDTFPAYISRHSPTMKMVEANVFQNVGSKLHGVIFQNLILKELVDY